MNAKQRLQFEELERRHLKDPKWFEFVLVRIAGGESVWDIADEDAYMPSIFRFWIKSDEARENAYQNAIEERKEGWVERLQVKAAKGSQATILDAKTASGEWLDVNLWPKNLLAACDSVEFGPDGSPYKIRMDAGKHADKLAKYVGLEQQSPSVNLNLSLVGLLSDMPKAQARQLPEMKQLESVESEESRS